jgi:FixJ family two-component response regulator
MAKTHPFVAVVDDEDSVRGALLRLLRAHDMECEGYPSGERFLDSLATRRPDCVVLDLQMAGLTGRDVQRRLKNGHEPIPIIIITAHDEPTVRQQCLADGAAAYLQKPLRSEILLRSIRDAIREPTDR